MPVHLRHPQATEHDLVEGRVGAARKEAVKLGGVRNRQKSQFQLFRSMYTL
jgi:hypothetical protein